MRKIIPLIFYFSVFQVLLIISCRLQSNGEYDLIKSATSEAGMVVTAHPLASEAGLEILKQGGNAADAAIAIQLVLAVVYPRAGNIGGGGFLVYRDEAGEVSALDFREKAPLASHHDMYLDSGGQVIDHLSTHGMLAAGIPGTVAGLVETHLKLGRLQPWSKLVEPAIKLAKSGFRITALEAERLNTYQAEFARYNPPGMPFLSKKPWKAGDLLVQRQLAATLQLIAEQGYDGFYTGRNAASLVSLSNTLNGIITLEDLRSYRPVWRDPLTTLWRGYKIHSIGLPSSGGIILGQILGMIDQHLIDSSGYRDPAVVHVLVEAERRAYADRARYLGDGDFYPVAVDSLLDTNYLIKKMNDFDPQNATKSQSIYADSFKMIRVSFETTHISIVDGEGNAASVTTTLNDNYGCKVWVPGGGYFLNNQMDDFSIKPGVPNIYGLIGGEANAIAPGKRMLSSMTPAIIEKDNRLWMVVGTPGGSTIITSVLQIFLNVAVFGMDMDQAVQASRFHHQWLPDEIVMEHDAFSPDLLQRLSSMGHTFNTVEHIGLIEAILVDENGILHGAADRRGDDHAAGW